MRTALISDMHGNGVGLDAVLADLERHAVDQVVCLGDAIQGGPQPAEVVARLRALACPVVMGNADAYLLSGVVTGQEVAPELRRKIEAVREWSLLRLSPDDRAFIAAFRPTVECPLGGGRSLLAFHGSPASFDEILLPDTPAPEFERALGAYSHHVLAGGHVHLPFVRRIGDNFHVNPGSVGLAYRHRQEEVDFRLDPWADYATLAVDGGRIAVEFRRVPFDVDALIEAHRASGRPYAEDVIQQYGR